jgi:hypothetical protein
MEKIVNSLKKCRINTSSNDVIGVLDIIARNDRNLEVGSVNTELAFSTYLNVKNSVGTETKSCIGNLINMRINGPVFSQFPFILSARSSDGLPKLIKILRVADGPLPLSTRENDMKYEARSSKFVHTSIVPSEWKTINIDVELAKTANCRVGLNEVLIMPWYLTTLDKQPSNDLDWIAVQGERILTALQFLHNFSDRDDECSGYVHMDVKSMNIFVDHQNICYLGDFGSCKPIGQPITSCSILFCWKDPFGLPAHPKYDYFMFLLMVLIECLEDRREFSSKFYEEGSSFASVHKVFEAAKIIIGHESTPVKLSELLKIVLAYLSEVDMSV